MGARAAVRDPRHRPALAPLGVRPHAERGILPVPDVPADGARSASSFGPPGGRPG